MIFEEWRAQAACLNEDTDLFFDPKNLRAIRQRCRSCPVFQECFEWCTNPVTVDEVPYGIIAGYTENQRMAIAGGRHVPDWRSGTGRNVTTPVTEVRAPTTSVAWQQVLERASARPHCPNCDTGLDVIKTRRNAAGDQVWRHLPCGRNFTEQEVAA